MSATKPEARPRYFHGGVSGLKPGDLLEPQAHPGWRRDDCAWCRSGGDSSGHPDSIYVTTEREYARYYASRYGKGWLYVVEPLGELMPSEEELVPSFRCESARVLSVYDRAVVLTRSQRRRVFKMLPGSPGYTFEMLERDAVRLVCGR